MYINTYIYIYVYICRCIYMYAYVFVYTYFNLYIYTYMYILICIHICMYTYMYNIYVCTCMYTYTYICTCMYMHIAPGTQYQLLHFIFFCAQVHTNNRKREVFLRLVSVHQQYITSQRLRVYPPHSSKKLKDVQTHSMLIRQIQQHTVTHCNTLQHITSHCNTLQHTATHHKYFLIHQQHTGWRKCIDYLKLQVIFRKRATNYRALLRKITYKDTASYDSTPPCNCTPPLSYILWAHKSKFIFKLKYSHVVNIVCYF